MRTLRAFFNMLPWLLGFGPDVPLANPIQTIEADREQARQAYADACRREDTRDKGSTYDRLRTKTNAALAAELVRG